MNDTDLSRILSLIITVLTDPYDQFIEKLRADGRITDEEVQALHLALKEQIPKLSELIKPPGTTHQKPDNELQVISRRSGRNEQEPRRTRSVALRKAAETAKDHTRSSY